MNDDAEIFASLRASTIRLLGYDDIEHLTAAQEIRISRAITLRLTIDDLQARQLRGERIDVSAFVEASESLERTAGGVPEGSTRFGPDHRAKLKALIERVVLGGSAVEHEAEADRMMRDEQQAIAAAAMPDDKSCASGRAQSGDVPSPSPSPSPAVPAGAVPPPRAETDLERMARVNSTPANPPPLGPREAWRDYVDDSGIIAPWFRPHG
jgi:hypothetical protein